MIVELGDELFDRRFREADMNRVEAGAKRRGRRLYLPCRLVELGDAAFDFSRTALVIDPARSLELRAQLIGAQSQRPGLKVARADADSQLASFTLRFGEAGHPTPRPPCRAQASGGRAKRPAPASDGGWPQRRRRCPGARPPVEDLTGCMLPSGRSRTARRDRSWCGRSGPGWPRRNCPT